MKSFDLTQYKVVTADDVDAAIRAGAKDLLLQDAPEDLYAAFLEKLGPERAAQVPGVAAALRAPLHPNCYLSPTQFAEKFGLPKPEAAREIPEKREKEEGEKGDTGDGDVGVSTASTSEPQAAPPSSERSEIENPQSAIKRGLRPAVVLFLLAVGAILGTLTTLITIGHVKVDAIGEQLRRLLGQ